MRRVVVKWQVCADPDWDNLLLEVLPELFLPGWLRQDRQVPAAVQQPELYLLHYVLDFMIWNRDNSPIRLLIT